MKVRPQLNPKHPRAKENLCRTQLVKKDLWNVTQVWSIQERSSETAATLTLKLICTRLSGVFNVDSLVVSRPVS